MTTNKDNPEQTTPEPCPLPEPLRTLAQEKCCYCRTGTVKTAGYGLKKVDAPHRSSKTDGTDWFWYHALDGGNGFGYGCAASALYELNSRVSASPAAPVVAHHKHCASWTVTTSGAAKPCDCVCECAHSMAQHIRPGEHYWYEDCAVDGCPCMKFTAAASPASTETEEDAEQTWCDHCSADLSGVKHILCERCYREFAASINTRESLRAAILDWLAHRCDHAPVCGICTYCRVAGFVRAVDPPTTPAPSSQPAQAAAREIRENFKARFVIPSEAEIAAIISRYFPEP